jgi:hypothetical protein
MLSTVRLGLLDRAEAVGFALIVWTYPGYQLWAGKANAIYVFSFGLLLVATWLLTLSIDARGPRHALLRVSAALLFFLSFALNSTMVPFAFVVLALFVGFWRRGTPAHGVVRRTWLAAWRCALSYAELLVLPLLYWGALTVWFKRSGVYTQHYNAHLPMPGELAKGWWEFFVTGYSDVVAQAVDAIARAPKPFIAAAILLAIALLALRPERKPSAPRGANILPFVLAVVLFLALSLPYLVAGSRPSSTHFYESRHLLMFGLPSALTYLAVKRWAERWIAPNIAFALVFGFGAILSIGMLWTDYIFMQARALKQEALEQSLVRRTQPAATVYALDDGFFDYPSRHVPFGLAEVTGMLRLAWGNQPFFGFALRAERPTVLREMEVARKAPGSAFHHFDPSGEQATISLQPGPGAAPNQVLVRQYYECRLLQRCEVSRLLDRLAQVTIVSGPIVGILPLDSPQPTR